MYPYDNFNYGVNPQMNMQQYNPAYQNTRPPQASTNKIYVSGVEEVKQKSLPAGSDYIFLDNDKPLLYQKIVSPNGQFEVKTFSIAPYTSTEVSKQTEIDLSGYVKTSDLEPIKAELTALKNKLEVNNGTTN